MADPRTKLDLPRWQFARRKPQRIERRSGLVDDAETLSLPHSWNADDVFLPGVKYYQGPGTYSCHFRLPDDERPGQWVLRSGGFYGTGVVWLDGRAIAKVDGQYLGFEIALPRTLELEVEHLLVLALTNRCAKHVLPGHRKQPDFVLFGGLASEVWLERRPFGHLDERTLDVRTLDALGSPRIELRVQRGPGAQGDDGVVTLRARLRSSTGEMIAEVAASAPPCGQVAELGLATPGVALWSPAEPHLYELEVELLEDGQAVDVISRRCGFRDIRFDRDGFWINGARLFLAGFNRHEWMPGQGNALSPEQHHRDAEILAEYGANFVRLSHYPQSPKFLDACDELGILVYAEIATWKSVRGGRWLNSAERQMRGMIERDRHHPSVILWGMGNESQHRGAYQRLSQLVHELDPSRPTTYAENHLYRARRARTLGLPDVWSINYEIDKAPELREHSKTGCVLVSEICNDLAQRGDDAAEAAQVASLESFWAKLERYPFIAGYLLWSFNDYPTLFRDRFTRTTGKFDGRRRPKPAAEAFRRRRQSESTRPAEGERR